MSDHAAASPARPRRTSSRRMTPRRWTRSTADPSLTAELDRLHAVDTAPATPAYGSDADHLTGAATALIGILRVCPTGAPIRRADLEPTTGRVVLELDRYEDAEQVAWSLGLPADHEVVVQIDGRWRKTWRGLWADWPVVVLVAMTLSESALTTRRAR